MLEKCVTGIEYMIEWIGDDPKREGLRGTPARIVRSWETLYAGYDQDPAEILSRMFHVEHDEMVVLRDIEFYSMCEHHLLPFFGKAHVAYLPGDKGVVGISKLARLVDCFARRLQIQERMAEQVADSLMEHVGATGCGVVLEAQHLCMVSRGVEKQNSVMVTTALRGTFKRSETREEFLRCVSK